MRMDPSATPAPKAIPALITGIAAVLLGFVSPLGSWIVGAGAMMLAGMAWADIKAYSYGGRAFALIGGALGVLGLLVGVLNFIAM
jgi:hypothetical protein